MVDLRVFFDILKGNVRSEANWVRDLGYIDDRSDVQTPECISAPRRSVSAQGDDPGQNRCSNQGPLKCAGESGFDAFLLVPAQVASPITPGFELVQTKSARRCGRHLLASYLGGYRLPAMQEQQEGRLSSVAPS